MKGLFIFGIINLILFILCWVFLILTALESKRRIKIEHPEVEFEKYSMMKNIVMYTRLILLTIIPFLNVMLLVTLIFNFDSVVESTMLDIINDYYLREESKK